MQRPQEKEEQVAPKEESNLSRPSQTYGPVGRKPKAGAAVVVEIKRLEDKAAASEEERQGWSAMGCTQMIAKVVGSRSPWIN